MNNNLSNEELHKALTEHASTATEHVKNNPVHVENELPDVLTLPPTPSKLSSGG